MKKWNGEKKCTFLRRVTAMNTNDRDAIYLLFEMFRDNDSQARQTFTIVRSIGMYIFSRCVKIEIA